MGKAKSGFSAKAPLLTPMAAGARCAIDMDPLCIHAENCDEASIASTGEYRQQPIIPRGFAPDDIDVS